MEPLCFHSSKFYFTDWDGKNSSAIYIADLTGANLNAIVTEKLVKPGALSIDYANEHLYFADMSLNVIERINLDGSNRRLIAIGMSVSTFIIIIIRTRIAFKKARSGSFSILYTYFVPPTYMS